MALLCYNKGCGLEFDPKNEEGETRVTRPGGLCGAST